MDIIDYERVCLREHKTEFIKEFLQDELCPHGIMCVKEVTWNSCLIKVDYVLHSGTHITTNFSLQLWNEFYEEYK